MAGEGSLFVEPSARRHNSRIPPRTPTSVLLSLTAPDGLSTPGIARLYAPYPYGKYNTSFGFSKRGPPHLVWPPEERFIRNLIYDLVHWLILAVYIPQYVS